MTEEISSELLLSDTSDISSSGSPDLSLSDRLKDLLSDNEIQFNHDDSCWGTPKRSPSGTLYYQFHPLPNVLYTIDDNLVHQVNQYNVLFRLWLEECRFNKPDNEAIVNEPVDTDPVDNHTEPVDNDLANNQTKTDDANERDLTKVFKFFAIWSPITKELHVTQTTGSILRAVKFSLHTYLLGVDHFHSFQTGPLGLKVKLLRCLKGVPDSQTLAFHRQQLLDRVPLMIGSLESDLIPTTDDAVLSLENDSIGLQL